MKTSHENDRGLDNGALSCCYRVALAFLCAIMLAVPATMAGPTDERHGIITMVLPDGAIDHEGDWRLHIISIGQFEREGWTFPAHRENIITQYLITKRMCGGEGVFYNDVRELTAEERGSITCVIDGVMNDTHCNTTTSAIQECVRYIPYKIDDDYSHDRKLMTFKSFYDSYMYDIGRADFYHHYASESCAIENGTCVVRTFIREGMTNPMMMVLEDTLSRDNVYFSEPTVIGCYDDVYAATTSTCEQHPCDAEILCEQEISMIATDGNVLRIEFGDHALREFDGDSGDVERDESRVGLRRIMPAAIITIGICLIALGIYLAHRRSKR